jgi:hypothetical protein
MLKYWLGKPQFLQTFNTAIFVHILLSGYAVSQAVSGCIYVAGTWFDLRTIHVGFAVDIEAMNRAFLYVVGRPLSVSFYQCSILSRTFFWKILAASVTQIYNIIGTRENKKKYQEEKWHMPYAIKLWYSKCLLWYPVVRRDTDFRGRCKQIFFVALLANTILM